MGGDGGKDIKRKSRIRKGQKGKREKGKDENEKKKRLKVGACNKASIISDIHVYGMLSLLLFGYKL